MICIGIPEEILKRIPMYDGMFHVFVDMSGFYEYAYNPITNIFILTDLFVEKFFTTEDLVEIISEIQKIKPQLDIILLGEKYNYEIAGTYLIKEKWDLATHVSNLVGKLHQREKSISTNQNNSIYRDFILNSKDKNDMVMYFLSNPYESMKFLRLLLSEYKNSSMNLDVLSNQIATLALENQSLRNQIQNVNKYFEETDEKYTKLKSIHDSLIMKINSQYSIPYEEEGEAGFTPAILNFKKVLYIKEISPVKYTQTMIYYLQNILNTISNGHTRCIVIEKLGAYYLTPLYPNFIVHNKLNYKDLKNEDILMIGYQKDIMLSILQNTGQHKYLIVWDKTGTNNIFIKNPKVKLLYTFSDIKDNQFFDFPKSNILCYEKSLKHISYIENFENLGIQDKLTKYSSMSIIKDLINALET